MYGPCMVNARLKINIHSRALDKHNIENVCSMYDYVRLKY